MSYDIRKHPMLQGLKPNRKVDEEDDPRYTEHELPLSLGKEPSKITLKSWFSNYGSVYLRKITNNSDHNVHFKNPYYSTTGDIKPGESESNNCKGYLPLWSYVNRYEITYYNEAFNKREKIYIKDLDGDWLISFWQDNIDEDIRSVPPLPNQLGSCSIEITINKSGYQIYNANRFSEQGWISW